MIPDGVMLHQGEDDPAALLQGKLDLCRQKLLLVILIVFYIIKTILFLGNF